MLTAAAVLVALTLAAPRNLAESPAQGDDVRVVDAPVDLSPAPDALEVSSGLVWLTLADGTPAPKATRIPAGLYLTAAGLTNLEASVDREVGTLRRDLKACREELAARRDVPLPGVPVAPPALASGKGWPSGVVIAVGVAGVLLGGLAGCYAAGGCR